MRVSEIRIFILQVSPHIIAAASEAGLISKHSACSLLLQGAKKDRHTIQFLERQFNLGAVTGNSSCHRCWEEGREEPQSNQC